MTDLGATIAPKTKWRTVVGFLDYEVSEFGYIRRTRPDARNHAVKVLRPWLNNKGYQMVTLVCDGVHDKRLVSRTVCEAFHGPPPTPKHEAAHGDGNPLNNVASNLRWATRSENMEDARRHGTMAMGDRHGRTTKPEATPRRERHGHARLTEEQVAAIRAAPRWVGSGAALAKRYGVSHATISLVRNERTWKND